MTEGDVTTPRAEVLSRKLWLIVMLDCTLGVILFLISLNILGSYLRDFRPVSVVPTVFWAIFSLCFIAEPVVSLTILLEQQQSASHHQIATFSTWLNISSKSAILTIPELVFFFVFYVIFPVLSAVGLTLCLVKLVLHFHKINTVSAYLRRRSERLGIYHDRSGSITPDIPSYGAFGPPPYEEAIKTQYQTDKV